MISIVLATYNERESIQTTIRALLKEAPEEMEIVVVDDDSPDQTWRVVESLDLPNVKIIRRIDTRGLASAFNPGIIESRGDYIGGMDAGMGLPQGPPGGGDRLLLPRPHGRRLQVRAERAQVSRRGPGVRRAHPHGARAAHRLMDGLTFGVVEKPVYVRRDDRGVFEELINTGRWESVIAGRMAEGAVMGHR